MVNRTQNDDMPQERPDPLSPEVQNSRPRGLDPFLKRYLVGMALLLVAGLVYFITQQDSRVSQINDKLATAPALVDYPYRFKVLSLEDGVAVVSSPRSAEMGPMHFLRILDPSLNDKDVVHPDMMAAQDLLVEKQSAAGRIVSGEPGVTRIRWQLDERWYARHGVYLSEM